jgi:hypothetical protein
MRTIRIELEVATTPADKLRISTEVIIEEGQEHQAGRDARRAVDEFINGYGLGND